MTLIIQDSEDLWHAYNLILPGDTISSKTSRYIHCYTEFHYKIATGKLSESTTCFENQTGMWCPPLDTLLYLLPYSHLMTSLVVFIPLFSRRKISKETASGSSESEKVKTKLSILVQVRILWNSASSCSLSICLSLFPRICTWCLVPELCWAFQPQHPVSLFYLPY